MGLIPEELARKFGHLSLAQVHAALAYYHANQGEIDADIEAEAQGAEASNNNTAARCDAIERRQIEGSLIEGSLDTCLSDSYPKCVWKYNSLPTNRRLSVKPLRADGFGARRTR